MNCAGMRKFEQGSTEKSGMVDGLLVAVTIFSLCLALVMSVITWRMSRGERQLPAGRSDGLAEAVRAGVGSRDRSAQPSWPPLRPATALRRGTAGPGATLAGGAGWTDLVLERTTALGGQPSPVPAAEFERTRAELPAGGSRPRRITTALGVGAAILATAIGVGYGLRTAPAVQPTTSPAAASVSLPIELVALDYARDGNHLTIRGLVRNPAAGSEMRELEAVVFLFDRQGGYLGTAHARVLESVLPPGSASPFSVPLAAGLDVSRYRVSFRVSTSPVPHVDRRTTSSPTPAAPARRAGDARTALVIAPAVS